MKNPDVEPLGILAMLLIAIIWPIVGLWGFLHGDYLTGVILIALGLLALRILWSYEPAKAYIRAWMRRFLGKG